MHIQRIAVLTLAIYLSSHCFEANAQDDAQIKERILASLSKVENYSAGVVKGVLTRRGNPERQVEVQFRNGKYRLESDPIAAATEAEKQIQIATLEVLGTANTKSLAAFDGKQFYEFSPLLLNLNVRAVKSLPGRFEDNCLLPQYWLKMGGSKRSEFRSFLEQTKYETTIEKLSDGRWKLSQSNLGSKTPGGTERVTIRDRYIIVDEKCDYLITEYHGSGGLQGTLTGTMEWAQTDGRWYVKKGQQTFAGMPHAEWTIDEISFDAGKVRTKFDDMENQVPFATRIHVIDQKGNILSTTYKGGKEGEAEFQLRELALLKRKKDGFK